MLTGSIILKHSSLSQKMEFPKVQSVFKLDHFLETMEMKSLKKNLALKIKILHLLRDLNGQTFITLKEDSLHYMSTLNDSLSLLKC